jgi:hypothetical protein
MDILDLTKSLVVVDMDSLRFEEDKQKLKMWSVLYYMAIVEDTVVVNMVVGTRLVVEDMQNSLRVEDKKKLEEWRTKLFHSSLENVNKLRDIMK